MLQITRRFVRPNPVSRGEQSEQHSRAAVSAGEDERGGQSKCPLSGDGAATWRNKQKTVMHLAIQWPQIERETESMGSEIKMAPKLKVEQS